MYLKGRVYRGEELDERMELVKYALYQSWLIESSSKWREENQAKGQCGVTVLVVNDLLGGDIKKTYLNDGWHYDNFIDGKRYDFTVSPFIEEIVYMDIPSTRIVVFMDTNERQSI